MKRKEKLLDCCFKIGFRTLVQKCLGVFNLKKMKLKKKTS